MRAAVALLAAILLVPACAGVDDATPRSTGSGTQGAQEVAVKTSDGEQHLSVRVADSDEERQQGLMGVRDLPANDGMAFVYDEPSTEAFWMKDTLLPLAIAFVDADGHILAIREMTPCAAEPCATYASPAPYMWAVEANSGWFSANGALVGDEAVLLEGG
jgi:uncharacterized membrane protein (UPF0127 family)